MLLFVVYKNTKRPVFKLVKLGCAFKIFQLWLPLATYNYYFPFSFL
jgi:hypothetical protein